MDRRTGSGHTHYFLPSSLAPIHGAEALAKNWKWWKDNLDSGFAHDHLLAHGDEVASEFSCVFTPPGTDKRLISRGTEWYVMRDGKILEVRAYCIVNTEHSIELATFPCTERGYRPTPPEVGATQQRFRPSYHRSLCGCRCARLPGQPPGA